MTGFSSWVSLAPIKENLNLNNQIRTEEIKNEENVAIVYRENHHLKKSEIYGPNSVVTKNETNGKQIEKIKGVLSWANKKNSQYLGELTDYFDIYDNNNSLSNKSPYLYLSNNSQNFYFENHKVNSGSIESSAYFSNIYKTIIDLNPNCDFNSLDKNKIFNTTNNSGKTDGVSFESKSLKVDKNCMVLANYLTGRSWGIKYYWYFRFYILYFLDDNNTENDNIDTVQKVELGPFIPRDRACSTKKIDLDSFSLNVPNKMSKSSIDYKFTVKYNKGGFIPTDYPIEGHIDVKTDSFLSENVANTYRRLDNYFGIKTLVDYFAADGSNKKLKIYYQYMFENDSSLRKAVFETTINQSYSFYNAYIIENCNQNINQKIRFQFIDSNNRVLNKDISVGSPTVNRIYFNSYLSNINCDDVFVTYNILFRPKEQYKAECTKIIKSFALSSKVEIVSENISK